jgi:hypothetical protein
VTAPAWHRTDTEVAVGENNEQCGGWLYTPAGVSEHSPSERPIIVMAHGLAGSKSPVWMHMRSGSARQAIRVWCLTTALSTHVRDDLIVISSHGIAAFRNTGCRGAHDEPVRARRG